MLDDSHILYIATLINEDPNIIGSPDNMLDKNDQTPLEVDNEQGIEQQNDIDNIDEDPELLRKQIETEREKTKAAEAKAKAAQEYAKISRELENGVGQIQNANAAVGASDELNRRKEMVALAAQDLETLYDINAKTKEKGAVPSQDIRALWLIANRLAALLTGSKYEAETTGR